MSEEDDVDQEDISKCQISVLWSFSLEDRYYIIFKKVVGAYYQCKVEEEDTQIHVISEFTPGDADIKLISDCINVSPGLVIPFIKFIQNITILVPPEKIHDVPQVHTKKEHPFVIISFPFKKAIPLRIE